MAAIAMSEPRRRTVHWARLLDVSPVDTLLALLLSVVLVALVTGEFGSNGRHGFWVAVAAITLTAPIAWRRGAPIQVAALLLAGALLNSFLVGPLVRCGAALPAMFLAGYALGRWVGPWRAGLAPCLFLAGEAVLLVRYDPAIRMGGAPFMAVLSVGNVGFWAAGRLVRNRAELVTTLAARTVALARQRDDNARLAVAADRGRIAADVDARLEERLDEVIAQAKAARTLVAARPAEAQQAFVDIQNTARATLADLRTSVRTMLDEEAPHRPVPVLAELTQLIEGMHSPETRLVIEGDPHVLPPGLELSAYRIVERLLAGLSNGSGAPVEVVVRFRPDALEIAVAAFDLGLEPQLDHALTVARQRAALHGGTVLAEQIDREWRAFTRLPLSLVAS